MGPGGMADPLHRHVDPLAGRASEMMGTAGLAQTVHAANFLLDGTETRIDRDAEMTALFAIAAAAHHAEGGVMAQEVQDQDDETAAGHALPRLEELIASATTLRLADDDQDRVARLTLIVTSPALAVAVTTVETETGTIAETATERIDETAIEMTDETAIVRGTRTALPGTRIVTGTGSRKVVATETAAAKGSARRSLIAMGNQRSDVIPLESDGAARPAARGLKVVE